MTAEVTQQEEPPLLEELRALISRAEQALAKVDVPPGLARMHMNRLRFLLSKIYGKDEIERQGFPGVPDGVPREVLRRELQLRTEAARRIVEVLSDLPSRSRTPFLGTKVFIGHGRSPLWRELKDFINERLGLPWDEFNREPVAGRSTTDRLQEMVSHAGFAFLIMTAEEERDQQLHARANVIHEIGLFQGRLGHRRAIVLLEDGCAEFSNIVGLSQIRFPRGKIGAACEEVRRVLEREGMLPNTPGSIEGR